jgi:hypothetical protein
MDAARRAPFLMWFQPPSQRVPVALLLLYVAWLATGVLATDGAEMPFGVEE